MRTCSHSALHTVCLVAIVPQLFLSGPLTVSDRPIHLVVLALLAGSFALPSASKVIPRLFQQPASNQGRYTAVPLEELGRALGRLGPEETDNRREKKVRVSILTATTAILAVRIELYRRISGAPECTIDSVEVFLPFMLALYDAVRSQSSLALEYEERPDSSVYESFRMTVSRKVLGPRTRYLFPLFLVSYGCYLAQGFWASSTSTFICPRVTGEQRAIPTMQIGALLLDLCLAIIAYETAPKPDGRGLSGRRYVILWTSAMFATVILWSVVAVIVYISKPEYRTWLLFLEPALDSGTVFAISGNILLFCLLCITTTHCVSSGRLVQG